MPPITDQQKSTTLVKTRWQNKRERTLEDRAGVVGFNFWKVAQEVFRKWEKEGFRFTSDAQVLDLVAEFTAFMLAVSDRLVYGKLGEADRTRFMQALATHLVKTMENNRLDLTGAGDHRTLYIECLNARAVEYAGCMWNDTGPSYELRRLFAEYVSGVMAVSDNKWVIEQVMDIEVPEFLRVARKVVGETLGIDTGA